MGAFNYQDKTPSTLPLCSAVYGGRTSISCRVRPGYQPHYQLLLGLYYARENNSCWDKPLRIWKLSLKHNLSHPNWCMSQTECRLLMGFHGIGVGVGSLSRGAVGKVELVVTERWVATWHSIVPKLKGHKTRNSCSQRKVTTTVSWERPEPTTGSLCGPPGMTDTCVSGPLIILISF